VNVFSGRANADANDLEVVLHRENVFSYGQAEIIGERALPKWHQLRRKNVLLNMRNCLQVSVKINGHFNNLRSGHT
jgi:hypothetical protein